MSTTTKAGHTPGPWSVSGPTANSHEIQINFTSTSQVAAIVNRNTYLSGIGREEAEANARLMAAAPELLEALISTTQTLQLLLVPMHPDDVGARAELRNEIMRAQEVIWKARGGQ